MDSEKNTHTFASSVPFNNLTQDFTPLRPRASPRSSPHSLSPDPLSPAHSFRSSCSDNDDNDHNDDEQEKEEEKEKGEEETSPLVQSMTSNSQRRSNTPFARIGRRLVRGRSALNNSRRRVAGEWRGFLKRDEGDGRQQLDDDDTTTMMMAAIRSASPEEMMNDDNEESDDDDDDDDDDYHHQTCIRNRFMNHRDTFEILSLRRHRQHSDRRARAIHLPHTVFKYLLRYVDFQTYLSLRLTCRCWAAAVSYVRPIQVRMPNKIPLDILRLVFQHLSSKDLKAARATCHAWKVASVGFRRTTTRFEGKKHTDGVDAHDTNEDDGFGYRLTMSACGDFVLATRGRLIYVCSVVGPEKKSGGSRLGEFRVLTRVVCPSHVRAVSFDATSHQRIWIGALLEGRAGMVCELKDVVASVAMKKKKEGKRSDDGNGFCESRSKKDEYHSLEEEGVMLASGGRIRLSGSFSFSCTITEQQHTIPVDEGPYFFYPRVCPDGDVPLSVAVCTYQQGRRCAIGFGSKTGVQVYCIDAFIGQTLRHWVSLSRRGEILCFAPLSGHSRHDSDGVDDKQDRIRLVSSLAVGRSSPPSKQEEEDDSGLRTGLDLARKSRTSYDDEGGKWFRQYQDRRDWRYQPPRHVVPLSDGSHVLYFDTWSGTLCLGELHKVVPSSPASSSSLSAGYSASVSEPCHGRDGAALRMEIKKRIIFEPPFHPHVNFNGNKLPPSNIGAFQALEVMAPTHHDYHHKDNFEPDVWEGLVVAVGFGNQVWGFFVERRLLSGKGRWRDAENDQDEHEDDGGREGQVRRITGIQIGELANGAVVQGLGLKKKKCSVEGGPRRIKMVVWAWGEGGERGKRWEWELELGVGSVGAGGGGVSVSGAAGGRGKEKGDGIEAGMEMKEWREKKKRRRMNSENAGSENSERDADGDQDAWKTEGPDGDVVMRDYVYDYDYGSGGDYSYNGGDAEHQGRDWNQDWERDRDCIQGGSKVKAEETSKALKYEDGTPVLYEGDQGEDVVMRDAYACAYADCEEGKGEDDGVGAEGGKEVEVEVEIWEV